VVDLPEEVPDVGLEDEMLAFDEACPEPLQGVDGRPSGRNPNEQGKKSASKMDSRTIFVACWATLSITVGMPNGRFDPSGFGISTRRTAFGR
jgi:hypothetical protein